MFKEDHFPLEYNFGLNLCHGIYSSNIDFDEQLISGLATAISTFGKIAIGKDIYHEEIKYKEYRLLIYRHKDIVGFISYKYPSLQLQYDPEKIIEAYDEVMNHEIITEMIDSYLHFGKPVNVK